MSRGHQVVVVTGRLGADPAVKAPPSGGMVAELRVAVSESYKDRAGNRTEHTEWIRIKVFGQAAEAVQRFLKKGGLVTVQGRLHTEKWTAGDGSDRYSTWVYASPSGVDIHHQPEHESTRAAHRGRAATPGPEPAAPAAQDWVDDDDFRF